MRQLGLAQIIVSAICFGFLGLFGKSAFAHGLSPGLFLSLRFLVAALFLAPYLWFFREGLKLPPRDLARCALLGTFGYAAFSSCFFLALKGLSASLTVLLLYTYPVLVCLGAWLLFGEKMRSKQVLALPLVLAGLLLVWREIRVESFVALGFGLLASLLYSSYILASSRQVKTSDPVTASFYIILSAGIALGLLHLRPGSFALAWNAWPTVLGAATVGTVLAISLFLAALTKLNSAEASLLSVLEPVTGVALAALFLGERLQPAQWLGAVLILTGMVLVATAGRVAKAGS
jgi:drug/metabolite transporter (DMT)-like permease